MMDCCPCGQLLSWDRVAPVVYRAGGVASIFRFFVGDCYVAGIICSIIWLFTIVASCLCCDDDLFLVDGIVKGAGQLEGFQYFPDAFFLEVA